MPLFRLRALNIAEYYRLRYAWWFLTIRQLEISWFDCMNMKNEAIYPWNISKSWFLTITVFFDFILSILEVETVHPCTLQFSPTVSPQLRLSVCVLVNTQKLSYFLSNDFANFWSEVRYRKTEKNYRALFSKKFFLNDPGKKNCIFCWFFDHFSKTTVTILLKSF